ncbi:restriction endonuclease subunit S [Acinetobacter baumannii]|uniref:restriction endonuclease subunit S n=1 Tax=Acinetobacter baumannii TaxID=470 RepID=UPI0002AEDB81|nr:restriction endonuclease subunit S [Acinetobacter baumannii]ELW86800.1 type I restriction modification DNA specificity domain protein [Acinetobacter baumannii WC-A-92]MDA3585898.1 restriction endonuclease subunit S [Acinetobacter baumannii]OTM20670.1 type I restriction endonuclease subunit R [Acinetobacter baumannii]SSQ72718.1 type I restriction-modification system specificity determinant for hsdM and hsdR (HsdS) [Acinetobacter baumannii]
MVNTVAKYQKYTEYKKSGVEWLGEIPRHWDSKPLKYLCTYNDEVLPETTAKDAEIQYIDIGSVSAVNGISKIETMIFKDAPSRARRIVRDGDVIVSTVRTYLEAIAPINNPPENLIVSTGFAVIRPNQYLYKSFASYCLRAKGFIKEVVARSVGVSYPAINSSDLVNIAIPSIEYAEQVKIANFLDHETTKIDHLIEKQQQLIELLKEKRQAVISHAVTKGLNPNVPMKDSGVEWLGEVPEHWDIVQAKYIADITRGAILRPVDAPEYFDEEGEWAYLNISDATKCDKYLDESKLRLSQLGSTKSARVYPNNLIITASATIGKAFINRIKVCVHDGFIPFCNIKLDINYLYHYVSNPYLYAAMGKSNTQKNIYLDEVKNMMVTVPPRCEQVAIVKHIESSQFKYDGLIQSANSAIKLMQERRTALISAAVTGKIDVRNWQAPTLGGAQTELSA